MVRTRSRARARTRAKKGKGMGKCKLKEKGQKIRKTQKSAKKPKTRVKDDYRNRVKKQVKGNGKRQ